MIIAIIGGGAAGLMAAATLLEQIQSDNVIDIKNHKVFLFEKNKILGAKVRISGGGRCNITTNITNTKELLTKFVRGGEFIENAIRSFTPKSIYKRFENNGLPLKIQADDRVFPASDNANDVVKVFEDIYIGFPDFIEIQKSVSVTDIGKIEDQFNITTKEDIYIVDKIILTTGGIAYRQTGSTGDGYAFAEKFGHKTTLLSPSLNSFLLSEKDIYTGLQGLSYLSKITFSENNKTKHIYGNIIWTHFGISGPGIFALASNLAHINIHSGNTIYISYLDKDIDYRKTEIEKYINQNPKKQIKTLLCNFLPEKLSDMIINITKIDGLNACGQLSKIQKIYIYKLLANGLPVKILERRPGDEFVTAGGIDTNLINPKTMESLLCKGLYFAGEILDVDGYTGGFNLTACRATGRLAAKSIDL